MSLIESKESQGNSGMQKTIDSGSMGLILDILQISPYKYPYKSTVRETVSNAVDAVKEKQIAIEILTGKSKVSDYYIEDDSDIKHSSNFDKDYYDLKCLNPDNKVTIKYKEGADGEKDQFIVKDCGVGLGGDRLQGYFNAAYSTKRNSKALIGGFGLGSKSPLSTLCVSFRMTSCHNGRKYTFDIYINKFESVTPKFNQTTGEPNMEHEFKLLVENEVDGEIVKEIVKYKFYSEPTDEYNSVEVMVPAKKIRRNDYINAVKSQLMYFPGLEFLYKYSWNEDYQNIDFKADIIYEDDDVIISNNSEYAVPHVVLGTEETKVVYGKVDFGELEEEARRGSIGLKLDVSDVSITPSREDVIYDDKTKEAVLNKFAKVQATAESLIAKEIDDEVDFINWAVKVSSLLRGGNSRYDYHSDSNVIDKSAGKIAILGEIIDKDSITLKFKPNPDILFRKHVPNFFAHVAKVSLISKDRWSDTASRTDVGSWDSFNLPIYELEGNYNKAKATYMSEQHPDGFVLIKRYPELDDDKLLANFNSVERSNIGRSKQRIKSGKAAIDLILSSKDVKSFDEYEVPEGAIADEVIQSTKTPAEIRESLGLIIYHKMVYSPYSNHSSTTRVDGKLSELAKSDVPIVYGNKADLPALHFVWKLMSGTGIAENLSDLKADDKCVFPIQIARKLNKEFKKMDNAMHVNDYLYNNIVDGVLVIPEEISNCLHAKYINNSGALEALSIFYNYASIDKDKYDKSCKIKTFVNSNRGFSGIGDDYYNRYVELYDLACVIQTQGHDITSEQLDRIKKEYVEIKDTSGITMTNAFNPKKVYNDLLELVEYTKPLGLLKEVSCINNPSSFSKELADLIKEYIDFKQNQ